jgi:serine/threonine protein kinase
MAKTTCTMKDFHSALRARDPLGLGFSTSIDPLLHLIWGLLAWDPKERLTAADALKHFFFTDVSLSDDGRTTAALQHQTLDPRLDLNLKEEDLQEFTCPKCGRVFDNLQSCQMHAHSRKHAKFCEYDRSLLPKCLNAHSMLPSHPTSGENKKTII